MERTGQVTPVIQCKNICKTFTTKGNSLEVLRDFNLDVKENEFVVLLGPGQYLAALCCMLAVVVLTLACLMPNLLRWYNSFRPLEWNTNMALLIAFYLCVPIALYALYNLEKLLRNILAGEVFIRPNVRIIRRVCICCLLVSAICLPAAFYYPPLIFFCIVMAFLCPVVNVVRYAFDAAVTIREENDLTI